MYESLDYMTWRTAQTKQSMQSEPNKTGWAVGMWQKVEEPVAKRQGYQPEPLNTKFWVLPLPGQVCTFLRKEVSQGLSSSIVNGLKYIFKISAQKASEILCHKKKISEKTKTRLL